MRDRDHECYFSGAHAAKDSGIALALGQAEGLNSPMAAASKGQFDTMIEKGIGELDKRRGRADVQGLHRLIFRDISTEATG